MKTIGNITRIITLALIALLIVSCAAAEEAEAAFTFYNGVTWDTTAEEMTLAEDRDCETTDVTIGDRDYAMYIFSNSTIDGYGAGYAYYYEGDALVFISVSYYDDTIAASQSTESSSEAVFTSLTEYASESMDVDTMLEQLIEAYGEPTQTDLETALAFYSEFSGGIDYSDSITFFAGWTLEDGTLICLTDLNGQVVAAYCNGTALDMQWEAE